MKPEFKPEFIPPMVALRMRDLTRDDANVVSSYCDGYYPDVSVEFAQRCYRNSIEEVCRSLNRASGRHPSSGR